MEEDKLRIPSTKRTCFVGRKKTSAKDGKEDVLVKVQAMLSAENHSENNAEQPEGKRLKLQSGQFVPRPAEIAVKNCTQVDKWLQEVIVNKIVKKCLESANPIGCNNEASIHKNVNEDWNMGVSLPLPEAASLLDKDELGRLKAECGGLQTLLRNHGHVFVVAGGAVRLRCHAIDPHGAGRRKRGKKAEVSEFRKKKLCWFQQNHPQGCPISSKDCLWAHGEADLRL